MESTRGKWIEWPTLSMLGLCYGLWLLTVTESIPWIGINHALLVLSITLYASLQHEMLHGHPFSSRVANAALVFLPIPLFFAYERFRDTHIIHHDEQILTEPLADPETGYLTPEAWARAGPVWRAVLRANQTLLGRILLGPAINTTRMVVAEARLIVNGDRRVLGQWGLYAVGLALLVGLLRWLDGISLTTYAVCAYLAYGLLQVRIFIEHRADAVPARRSVIIERGGLLGLLFLNNHLHLVHHRNPDLPWYALPALYRRDRAHYTALGGGYVYPDYPTVFRRYLLRPREPIAHPLTHPR